MKNFEVQSDGGMCITDNQTQICLTSDEAYTLWQWLSARKEVFQAHSGGRHLEIRLYQKDLSHLEELRAAIPDLYERGPAAKVFNARWDAVSEQALKLLKTYQIEYHIHPLLEDEDTYAQG